MWRGGVARVSSGRADTDEVRVRGARAAERCQGVREAPRPATGVGTRETGGGGAEPSPATTPLAGGALGIWDAPHRVGLIFLPVTVTLKPPVSLWVSGDKSMCSGISCYLYKRHFLPSRLT